MNDTIRQLYDRKSVRVYTDEPIDESIVQEILYAAAMAPTAGNQQFYTIIRVTDQELLDRLAESCDHQPFIAKGKLVLVFCADCLKWYKGFSELGCDPREPGPGDLLLAVDDAVIAAQNAVVAAESYGIGSCYIGDIMENIETQREILGLSACGTDCSACYCRDMCAGCSAACGKVFHMPEGKACPIYACCVNRHKYATCASCPDVPCGLWPAARDPSYSDEQFEASIAERVGNLKGV